MLKEAIALTGIVISITACTNTPSPQSTTPSHEAQCAALRVQLSQTPMTTNDNNTASAVADAHNADMQQQYHHECE